MKKKLTIILSLCLLFLTVTLISYLVTQSIFKDDNKGNVAINSQDTISTSADTNSAPTKEVSKIEPSPTSEDAIQYGTEVPLNKTGTAKTAVYAHTEPLTNSETVRTVPANEQVNVISEINGWYKLGDDTFVYKTFISLQ